MMVLMMYNILVHTVMDRKYNSDGDGDDNKMTVMCPCHLPQTVMCRVLNSILCDFM